MQTGATTLENSMEVPQKVKNRATLWPSNCTTRYLSKGYKMLIQRGTCTPVFTAALSTTAKLWKEPTRPSTDKWIKKMWYIYTMEYYSVIKKNDILPFATMWMELECIMLSKISQSEKDRWFHSYVDFKKQNKWAKEKKERERDEPRNRFLTTENKLIFTRVGGWGKWVTGIKEGTRCDEHQVWYGSWITILYTWN